MPSDDGRRHSYPYREPIGAWTTTAYTIVALAIIVGCLRIGSQMTVCLPAVDCGTHCLRGCLQLWVARMTTAPPSRGSKHHTLSRIEEAAGIDDDSSVDLHSPPRNRSRVAELNDSAAGGALWEDNSSSAGLCPPHTQHSPRSSVVSGLDSPTDSLAAASSRCLAATIIARERVPVCVCAQWLECGVNSPAPVFRRSVAHGQTSPVRCRIRARGSRGAARAAHPTPWSFARLPSRVFGVRLCITAVQLRGGTITRVGANHTLGGCDARARAGTTHGAFAGRRAKERARCYNALLPSHTTL
eukprot:6945001-Prymnesium_polylepis.1